MINFFVLLAIGLLLLAGVYLVGVRRGGQDVRAELLRVRLESIAAERELRDLARQAFVAMSQYAEKRRHG